MLPARPTPFFLKDDGRVFGTGANFDGQLGDGDSAMKVSPGESVSVRGAEAVSAAGDSSCVAEWQLKCFGNNRDGQLGLKDTNLFRYPTEVPSLNLAVSVGMGDTHSFFLNHDQVFVTGSNTFGQLGDNSSPSVNEPQVLMTLGRASATTTLAPTPSPTPAPPPAPTPSPTPEPTRAPSGGLSGRVLVIALSVILGATTLMLLMSWSCGGNKEPRESDELRRHSTNDGDLELMRGQILMD